MKKIIIFLLVASIVYLISYIGSINSDAYDKASMFIIQSSVVNNELGNNIEVSLSPFGYELEQSGSWGTATFSCQVKGSKFKGDVQITLKKTHYKWQVKEATLLVNGQSQIIDLITPPKPLS